MPTPSLEHLTVHTLHHNGDCGLLGVTPDLTVYVEEVYGEEGWLAQHALALDGSLLDSVDEVSGTVTQLSPLSLPENLIEPQRGWHTMGLNFTGPRHRGLRGPERLDDLVHPFSVQEKFAVVKQLQIDIMPPLLLGLAESYVLSEAAVRAPNLFLVCRRLRLAYALTEERQDADGEPYDYDTMVLHVAHFHDVAADEEPALSVLLSDLNTLALHRPMDCLIYKDHLFIADGGGGERNSAVHIWHIQQDEPTLSDNEQLRRNLYG